MPLALPNDSLVGFYALNVIAPLFLRCSRALVSADIGSALGRLKCFTRAVFTIWYISAIDDTLASIYDTTVLAFSGYIGTIFGQTLY